MDLVSVFSGAGAATITGAIALWIKKVSSTESLEERLHRWQESTVLRVHAENAELRAKVDACETKHAAQATRGTVIEACFRLAIPALCKADPGNSAIAQCSALMRTLPVDPNLPPDWIEFLSTLD